MEFHKSLLDILNSRTKVKIIRFLLTLTAPMSEREIASVLKVSHMSVNRTLRELAEFNLVNFATVGKAHLWRVNKRSYAFRVLSKFIEGISEIQEPIEDLKKSLLKNLSKDLIKRIILFGSVAKSAEKANSDIDVFILAKDRQSKKELEPQLNRLSNLCLERYGNRLAPYLLTPQEMKRKKNSKVISEINKGLEIYTEKDK